MEELEEMKEAFDNLTKSALQLNEMYKKKNKIIDNAKEYIELLENAFIKGEPLDIVLLDTERQILEGDEIPDITRKYLKEKIKSE